MKTVRDMYSNQDEVVSLVPAVRTADVNGTGVDLRDFDGNTITFNVGAEGITLSGVNKIELKVEVSDDDVTYVACPNDDLLRFVTGVSTGTVVVLDDNTKAPGIYSTQYIGPRRYVRGALDYAGTHGTGTIISCVVKRGYPHFAPVR
jgi:hypothetical protein